MNLTKEKKNRLLSPKYGMQTLREFELTAMSFGIKELIIRQMVFIAIKDKFSTLYIYSIIRKLESLSLSNLIPTHTSTEEMVSTPLSIPSESRPAD